MGKKNYIIDWESNPTYETVLLKQRELLLDTLQRVLRTNALPAAVEQIINDSVFRARDMEHAYKANASRIETATLEKQLQQEKPLTVGILVKLRSDTSCIAEIISEKDLKGTKLYNLKIVKHKDNSVIGQQLHNMAAQYLTTILS